MEELTDGDDVDLSETGGDSTYSQWYAVQNENSVCQGLEEAMDKPTYSQLMEKYKQMVKEQHVLREANVHMQTKLCEYFRRKKAEVADSQLLANSQSSFGDQAVDYESKYSKYLNQLVESRENFASLQITYRNQIEELKKLCESKQKEIDELQKSFTAYKISISKRALNSRTARPLNLKDIEIIFNNVQRKEEAVVEVRLENIKLQNDVNKFESILKSKEQLAEGLHLIDFEQLKIENQTYNEKIEERNEELTKLRKKISNTVQIMTHVKEKLQAVTSELYDQKGRLKIADDDLTESRDKSTKVKQARDKLRAENSKLVRTCGLLGKTNLLLNYEDCLDSVNAEKEDLNKIKHCTSRNWGKTEQIRQKLNHLNTN